MQFFKGTNICLFSPAERTLLDIDHEKKHLFVDFDGFYPILDGM
jgi:hypothetical protein